MQLVFRLGHVIKQEFQNQSTAQPPPLNLEMRKAHRQINLSNVVDSDESGILIALKSGSRLRLPELCRNAQELFLQGFSG